MTDRDPAFIWETEALRAANHRLAEAEIDTKQTFTEDSRWVTLREANRTTGIPVETLRKWARRATIPTYLKPTDMGTNIRMVDLDGVLQRAHDLGRPTSGTQKSATVPEPTGVGAPPADETAPTAGTMIVPVDAWNKMLTQLGNLHEAGQQLAEARERAAKAETEATFLRERLSEIRHENAEDQSPVAATTESQVPESATQPPPQPPEKVWRYLVRRMRDRNQG